MSDQLNPTKTLAELYENQNQLLDALMVYQKLQSRQPSTELENKITEIKIKIFDAENFNYNPVIDQIFTKEEKMKFNILPHSYYKNIQPSLKQPKIESMEDIEETETDLEPIIKEDIHKELDDVFQEFNKEHREMGLITSTEKDETQKDTEEKTETSEDKLTDEKTDAQKKADDIQTDDDFFNLPFDDIAKTFKADQQEQKKLDEQITEQDEKSSQKKQDEEKTEKKDTDIDADRKINLATDLEKDKSLNKKAELKVDQKIEKIKEIETSSQEDISEEEIETNSDEETDSDNAISDPESESDETDLEKDSEIEESFKTEIEDDSETEIKKFPRRENLEGLSFEELMAKLDEEKAEKDKKDSEDSPEYKAEEKALDQKKFVKDDLVKVQSKSDPESKEYVEHSKQKNVPQKDDKPFEYVEDDISLKQLEEELKAEFQKTRKQVLQVDDEPEESDQENKIKDNAEKVEEKVETLSDGKITPDELEKILASNKTSTEDHEEEIIPIIPSEKENLKDEKMDGFKQEEDISTLDDLTFSEDTSKQEEEDEITNSKSDDLTDLSFEKKEISEIETDKIQQKKADELDDLEFSEQDTETEEDKEQKKTEEKQIANDLKNGFDDLEKTAEKKVIKKKNNKRASEYVPGANQSEDEFFSQSFDEIIKQKDVGFKAEDVLRDKINKDDGKEEQ